MYMKIPLRYQITEYDCATVSLENVISYLFDREEITISIIKTIYLYTLDCYDDKGKLGHGGTSIEAINFIIHWLYEYSTINKFDIRCRHCLKNEVVEENIRKCIDKKGCVLLRTYLSGEHYVLVTDIDEKFVYLWDPYYLDENYFKKNGGIDIIYSEPFKYNRRVNLKIFNSYLKNDYALGPLIKRECVLFWKKL